MNRSRFSSYLRCLAFLGATVGVVGQGVAQSDKDEPPKPPFLNKLPQFARYEMVEAASRQAQPKVEPGKPALEHLTRVVVTKTGDIKKVVGTYSGGSSVEGWVYKGVALRPQGNAKGGGSSVVMTAASEDTVPDLPLGNAEFRGLDWLATEYYQHTVSFEGKKCYLFQRSIPQLPTERVFVDVETKLPVFQECYGFMYHFTFDDPPTEMLKLSPSFEKAWHDYEASMRAVTARSGPR